MIETHRTSLGIRVHIEGQGPPIVMVHGWPDTDRLWDPQVEAFKPRYRCARFTLPGFSDDTKRRAYSVAEVLSTLGEVVELAGRGAPVTLMLHDWGCFYGYRWALQNPSRVSRIVGIDIGDAGSKAHRRSLAASAKAGVVAYQWWLALAWLLGGWLGDAMTRRMAALALAPAPAQNITSAMTYPYWLLWSGRFGGANQDVAELAQVPLYFAYGRRKPFAFHSPQWAERLALRPGCVVKPYDTGHWVSVQASDSFNRDVLDWLSASA